MDQLTVGTLEEAMERQVSGFTAFLRRHGFPSTVLDTKAALEVLREVLPTNRDAIEVYWQSIYATTKEQWEVFPALFRRYFDSKGPRLTGREAVVEDDQTGLSGPPAEVPDVPKLTLQSSARALLAYSPRWGGDVSLSPDPDLDVARMKPWTRVVLNHWAHPRGQRWKSPCGPTINWPGTVRTGFRHGGDAVQWTRQHRRRMRPRLVAVIDVSGSMAAYAPFYLGLVWHLVRMGSRVECFVSSNRMVRVTEALRRSRPGGQPVADAGKMGGGTRLGWAFSVLQHKHRTLLNFKTTLLVASDGFDAGDIWMLVETFPRIAQAVGQVIWMNPLLLEPGYEPRSAALKVVLPYCAAHVGVRDALSWVEYAKSL
ncbi:VWA containing CoxE family protein [Sulfobacillus acidophilus TPY]|uniref:VWA containing CoxE family protein n=1 Tax=Sulfobacillus acidophilus (strain ATCC 700253 / DSM 10332 / NAL) TaxID=679936 RepID=G8TYS3_SULAD|nr:VWA containing CoxE family protein [Sulfobacillus acidophilus TPY]AEW04038.1 VWA containing CoxE family protein [Sulfobacillus acidophilus DSM 10332]